MTQYTRCTLSSSVYFEPIGVRVVGGNIKVIKTEQFKEEVIGHFSDEQHLSISDQLVQTFHTHLRLANVNF